MTEFDPYEVLGVDRDATEEEIKMAGKRAAKQAHPDAGGSAEEFQSTRRALAVLTNPKRRKQFDRTGKVDDVIPDNREAAAMGIIASALSAATNEYLLRGFDPKYDPRTSNLISRIAANLSSQVATGGQTVRDGKRHRDFLRDLAKRFRRKDEGFDFIGRQIADEIRTVEDKIRAVEESIDHHKLALELLRKYDFDATMATYNYATFTGT